MKTLITTIALALTLSSSAQIAIGTTTVETDALVTFGTEARGMVISPSSNVTAQTATAGTIAFDAATGSFRMYDGTWSTAVEGGKTGGAPTGTDTYKTFTGATTSTADGVWLIGEDSGEAKALVLPKVANGNLKFNKLTPGLMYYDTAYDKVMIYNGHTWVAY